MIPLEGRIIPGLDEFMLRTGHLRTLCCIASEHGGPWSRIQRELSVALASPVAISQQSSAEIADYLRHKKLCPIAEEGEVVKEATRKLRYPRLLVRIHRSGESIGVECTDTDDGACCIWWQDACLAAPGIPSRVGAVTISAKAGSKTGSSHICDWAQALDLITASGQLTPEGELLARLHGGHLGQEGWLTNPYLIHPDRIILAYQHLIADFDVFARLAKKLGEVSGPIRKALACELFASTMMELGIEAETAAYLPASQQFRVLRQVRELEDAAKKGDHVAKSSIVWHRASSRLETYVDLGLLCKGCQGEQERYEYTYYRSPNLERLVGELNHSDGAIGWLEDHLVSLMFDRDYNRLNINIEETFSLTQQVARALSRPTSVLPITALALGIVSLLAERGEYLSVSTARRSLVEMAQKRPDLARLSRGGHSQRAEFLSLVSRRKEV